MKGHPSRDERRALTAARVTLNGVPARISGVDSPFATVRQIGTGRGCEWDWATVALIVSHDGRFKS